MKEFREGEAFKVIGTQKMPDGSVRATIEILQTPEGDEVKRLMKQGESLEVSMGARVATPTKEEEE